MISWLAVEKTLSEINWPDDYSVEELIWEQIQESIKEQIKETFERLVWKHAQLYPLDSKEYEGSIVYGTTIICAAKIKKYMMYFQIGDGVLRILNQEGRLMTPLPADERCVGGGTSSVCQTDAVKSMRIAFSSEMPAGILLATDGLQDIHKDEYAENIAYDVILKILDGECTTKLWYEVLYKSANLGIKRDDSSVIFLIDKTKVSQENVEYHYQQKRIASKMMEIQSRIEDKRVLEEVIREQIREGRKDKSALRKIRISIANLQSELRTLEKIGGKDNV